MPASPTSRTLQECKKRGWRAQRVERYCPHSKRRIDLFGFGDVVAVTGDSVLAIQTTSVSNQSNRFTKITTE